LQRRKEKQDGTNSKAKYAANARAAAHATKVEGLLQKQTFFALDGKAGQVKPLYRDPELRASEALEKQSVVEVKSGVEVVMSMDTIKEVKEQMSEIKAENKYLVETMESLNAENMRLQELLELQSKQTHDMGGKEECIATVKSSWTGGETGEVPTPMPLIAHTFFSDNQI